MSVNLTTDGSKSPINRLAVCIATCGRPETLNRLLKSISQLKLERHSDVELSVIIVDNHSKMHGQSVTDAWIGRMPFPIRYATEPTRGVSSARNRLVALAEDCDAVAFIDDDETAADNWIEELLSAQMEFSADVVQGMVRVLYEKPLRWLVASKIFEMKEHPYGQSLPEASTANALVTIQALKWIQGPFDERLNLSGGEDIFLFRQLAAKGARIVFTDRAVTEEIRPPSRCSLRWYCQRAFRIGNTNVIVDRFIHASVGCMFRWGAYALGRFAQGLLFLVRAPFSGGRVVAFRGLMALCLGAGNLYALFGLTYREYQRSSG